MIKPNAGVTDYFSMIKMTDKDKLRERSDKDKEAFISASK